MSIEKSTKTRVLVFCCCYEPTSVISIHVQSFPGGGLCCLSSFPYIWDKDGVPEGDERYFLALVGQAITGVAIPLICGLPTKVRKSQIAKVL